MTQTGTFVRRESLIALKLLIMPSWLLEAYPAQAEKQSFREKKELDMGIVQESRVADTNTTWSIHASQVGLNNFLAYYLL